MDLAGDEPRTKRHQTWSTGDDLSLLSEDELSERIEALKAEIERAKASLEAKQGARGAAESVFSR